MENPKYPGRSCSGLSWSVRTLVVAALVLMAACRDEEPPPAPPVTSVFEGRLTVSPEIDDTPDYSGFEVLVAQQDTTGVPDTLGYAVTDTSGAFRMAVTAPERGVYPLFISRRGTMLKAGELVVAAGDTASLAAEFPMDARPLRIRSRENAAWTAYRNTRAQYNDGLLRLLQQGTSSGEAVGMRVEQTSAILWSLRETFAGTVGADVASAESIAMLDGWNDSLLVARAQTIEPSNPSFVEVVRAARRAQARLAGQDSALALVRAFQQRTDDPEQRAGIQSEIVVALSDSLQRDEAVVAARELKRTYAATAWAGWADRAIFEIEHLSPGMPAPGFSLVTRTGEPVSLSGLRGRFVVLEFYRPEDPDFLRQLPARNALATAVGADTLQFVSVSLQPDTLLNDAFADGRAFPGLHVIAPQGAGSDIARDYNVHALPTRILIDREGNVVRKYVGTTLARLQDDLVALLVEPRPPA